MTDTKLVDNQEFVSGELPLQAKRTSVSAADPCGDDVGQDASGPADGGGIMTDTKLVDNQEFVSGELPLQAKRTSVLRPPLARTRAKAKNLKSPTHRGEFVRHAFFSAASPFSWL